MAGPTLTLLLRDPLDAVQQESIITTLRTHDFDLNLGEFGWQGYLDDPARYALGDYVPCTVGLDFRQAQETDIEEEYVQEEEAMQRQIANVLGFTPQQAIDLYAMCNSKGDHRVLAHMALTLMADFDIWIDFNGALEPPLSQQHVQYHWLNGPRPDDITPIVTEMMAYVSQFGGHIAPIQYQTAGGHPWIFHIADAAFFRAWLAAPHFYLIK